MRTATGARAPSAINIARRKSAMMIPKVKTLCWCSRGTAKVDMMMTKTNRLSMDELLDNITGEILRSVIPSDLGCEHDAEYDCREDIKDRPGGRFAESTAWIVRVPAARSRVRRARMTASVSAQPTTVTSTNTPPLVSQP